jgi:hypothetical protein
MGMGKLPLSIAVSSQRRASDDVINNFFEAHPKGVTVAGQLAPYKALQERTTPDIHKIHLES